MTDPHPRRRRLARAALLTTTAAVALGACARPGTTPAGGQDSATPAAATVATGALPLKLAPRPTTAEITEADLMTRLYVFADDSMLGREAGTEGNVKGAAYIARELQRLGLQPAGENGGWFQDVPLVRRRLADDAALGVDGRALVRGTDWMPAVGRGTLRSLDGRYATLFAGAWGTAAPLTREQVAGRVVVFRAADAPGAPPRVAADSPLQAAAAVLVVAPLEAMTPAARATQAAPSIGLAAASAGTPPAPQLLLVSAAAAERMLGAPLAGLAPGAAGRTVEARLRIEETPAPARNVVAILPGSDPALRGQYVALGAHNDHVGSSRAPVDHDSLKAVNAARRRVYVALDDDGDDVLTAEQQARYRERIAGLAVNVDSLRRLRPARPDSIANGADDDGSGSMALLEIAEQVAAQPARPRRSLLFVWHTGEEKGLLGARWYTARPTVPLDSIVAQLNIDMIGRGGADEERHGGPDHVGLIGAGRLSSELDSLAQRVNRAQARSLAFDRALDRNGHPENIYCRSDHYEYAKYGIPIAFFFTGLHGDYHQVTDEPQYIDYAKFARITRYVRDLAAAVADRPARPVVDGPRPNPTGVCRQ